MSWTATIVGGAAIGSALIGSNAAKNAGKAAQQGADAAARAQLAMYQQSRTDLGPQRQIGGYALDAYARAMGLAPYNPNDNRYNQTDPAMQALTDQSSGAAFAPADPSKLIDTGQVSDGGRKIMVDPATGYGYVMAVQGSNAGAPVPIGAKVPGYEPQQPAAGGGSTGAGGPAGGGDPNDRYGGFYASPGYKFTLDEALQGVERSAGAGGYLPSGPGSLSGRFSKAMSRYSAGLASGEFNNYMARLGDLSGIGSNAATSSSNAALTTGANVGNARIAGGNARASAVAAQGNAWSGALQDVGNAAIWGGVMNSGQRGYLPATNPYFAQQSQLTDPQWRVA